MEAELLALSLCISKKETPCDIKYTELLDHSKKNMQLDKKIYIARQLKP